MWNVSKYFVNTINEGNPQIYRGNVFYSKWFYEVYLYTNKHYDNNKYIYKHTMIKSGVKLDILVNFVPSVSRVEGLMLTS